ncbi:hypothetical protein [Peptostreptococcus anaerobius]|uniref:hypothetical protein n=1 Tax=Peptostreptococcus anaerobius TaxID=1261 RepID=UPI00321B3A6B
MAEERLEAVITLVDEYTERVLPIIQRTRELKETLDRVKTDIPAPKDNATPIYKRVVSLIKKIKKEKITPKEILIRGAKATKELAKIRKEAMLLNAKRIALNIKNTSTASIARLGRKLKDITKKRWEARVGVKDKASGTLSKIKATLGVLAAGVVIKATVQKGMELEQQKVSMEHFMGVGNQGKSQSQIKSMTNSYIKQLRANANATPFETGEVIKAGTRALTISGGDTRQSMKLVKLAEDMAASDPNKNMGDAIEALADAKMGEFERLKEFGFKGTKEDFDKAGGDFFKMKSKDGQTLDGLFGGLAAKQSKTSSGMLSTIKGNIGNLQQNLGTGILEGIKPALAQGVSLFSQFGDNAGVSLGQKIGGGLSNLIQGLMGLASGIDLGGIFESFKTGVQPAIDLFQTFYNHIKNKTPESQAILQIFGTIVRTVFEAMRPVVQLAGDVIKGVMRWIAEHSREIQSVIQALKVIWDIAWKAITLAVMTAGKLIRPVINGIVTVVGGIADAINGAKRAWDNFKKAISGGAHIKVTKEEITERHRHAYGQARVPYNNYNATLHEGERVLTKQEANQYDNNKGKSSGVNINIYGLAVREQADIDLIAARIVKKMNIAIAGGV